MVSIALIITFKSGQVKTCKHVLTFAPHCMFNHFKPNYVKIHVLLNVKFFNLIFKENPQNTFINKTCVKVSKDC